MINIGIDAHKKVCVTTIKGDTPEILEQAEFRNRRDAVSSFAERVKRRYGGHTIKAVCESTANYWMVLHDTPEDHGIDTLLAHPAKIKAIAEARLKDDKMDPAIPAGLLRMDMVYESFVPDKYYRGLRSLSWDRIGMTEVGTGQKNRITATMAKYDYGPPAKDKFGKKGLASLRGADIPEIDRMSPDAHPGVIETAARHRDAMERKIASICSDDPRARLLMTMPGISHITAPGILSEIAGIGRFRTDEKLGHTPGSCRRTATAAAPCATAA